MRGKFKWGPSLSYSKAFSPPWPTALRRHLSRSLSSQTDSEESELRSLNSSLAVLSEVFPDVQVEVFREMLSYFKDSGVQMITEELIKRKPKWVRGRWRTPGARPTLRTGQTEVGEDVSAVPTEEQFRTTVYKQAVKAALCQEFRGFPRSSIEAVLAEYNYSYTQARPVLHELSSRSWWFSLSSFFLRPKQTTQGIEKHPCVAWMPLNTSKDAPLGPTLKKTESDELNEELFDTVIRPLQEKARREQIEKDYGLAASINESQAETFNELQDCECCFTSSTFEQLCTCDMGKHFICFRCVRHATKEAVFGQGWARNVDVARGTLRCLAPTIGDGDGCEGCIPTEFMHRVLDDGCDGENMMQRLEDRLAMEELVKTRMPLVRCPFCNYAEVDDASSAAAYTWRLKRDYKHLLSSFPVFIFSLLLFPALPLIMLALLPTLYLVVTSSPQFADSLTRQYRKRRGLRFACQSPSCGRSSCLTCAQEWRDIHVCYESERQDLRVHVERAMAEAVKRTCPRCNTSFIKASGCNKLTCVCGYKMCYVCRSELGEDGYKHFCSHFRPQGHRDCTECDKCDLYHCEDDAVAAKRAAKCAELEWRAKQTRKEGLNTVVRKELAGLGKKRDSRTDGGWWSSWESWTQKSWPEILDLMVDRLIEVQ